MALRAIDFPDHTDPSFNEDEPFEAPNGITYTWNGYGWEVSCGFGDPECQLDAETEFLAYVAGTDLAEGQAFVYANGFYWKGDQTGFIEDDQQFQVGTDTFTVSNIEVIEDPTHGEFTKVDTVEDPTGLIGQTLEVEGFCAPIGKRYLLAHGDTVDDADGIVDYQWNQDVRVILKDDNFWTFKNTQDYFQLESADDDELSLNAELQTIDINASTTVLNSQFDTTLRSNNRDIKLEAGNGVERVDRTIDDTSDAKQITNKEYVDAVTDQLHQDIISLDEEIESIARSSEKGFWRYDQASAETRPPFPGKFFLLKNYSPNTGGIGSEFTTQYSEANAAVFHNIEWNVDDPTGVGGEEHTWADVEVGHLLDILDKPDPDGLFGRITDIDLTAHAGEAVIIAFETIEYLGSPTNLAPFQSLLKIFKEPEGGSAEEFVKKTGDKMSGDLVLDSESESSTDYDPNQVTAKITFRNTKADGTKSYVNLWKNGAGGYLNCDTGIRSDNGFYAAFGKPFGGRQATHGSNGIISQTNIRFNSDSGGIYHGSETSDTNQYRRFYVNDNGTFAFSGADSSFMFYLKKDDSTGYLTYDGSHQNPCAYWGVYGGKKYFGIHNGLRIRTTAGGSNSGTGSSGQVPTADGNGGIYWKTPSTSTTTNYVKTNSTGFSNSLTITKSGSTYYITGG